MKPGGVSPSLWSFCVATHAEAIQAICSSALNFDATTGNAGARTEAVTHFEISLRYPRAERLR